MSIDYTLIVENRTTGAEKGTPITGGAEHQKELQLQHQYAILEANTPDVRHFYKYIGSPLQEHWYEIGKLLGVPDPNLNAIRRKWVSDGTSSKPMIDLFSEWERSEQFTWKSLFQVLEDLNINDRMIQEHKRNLIQALHNK